MSFYNTGNPVPSIDPRDLDDNAKHLDVAIHGAEDTWVDRLGATRKSIKGVENGLAVMQEGFDAAQAERVVAFDESQDFRLDQFNLFLDSSGYEAPVTYAAGLTLIRATQVVTYLSNEYRVKSQFLPLTTTVWAADEPKLKLIGDDSLRQEVEQRLNRLHGPLSGYKVIAKPETTWKIYVTGNFNFHGRLIVLPETAVTVASGDKFLYMNYQGVLTPTVVKQDPVTTLLVAELGFRFDVELRKFIHDGISAGFGTQTAVGDMNARNAQIWKQPPADDKAAAAASISFRAGTLQLPWINKHAGCVSGLQKPNRFPSLKGAVGWSTALNRFTPAAVGQIIDSYMLLGGNILPSLERLTFRNMWIDQREIINVFPGQIVSSKIPVCGNRAEDITVICSTVSPSSVASAVVSARTHGWTYKNILTYRIPDDFAVGALTDCSIIDCVTIHCGMRGSAVHADGIQAMGQYGYADLPAIVIISMTNASPGVFTVAPHDFVVGEEVAIVPGNVAQLPERAFINTVPTSSTFTLKGLDGVVLDTTAFTAYVSGATIRLTSRIVDSGGVSSNLSISNYVCYAPGKELPWVPHDVASNSCIYLSTSFGKVRDVRISGGYLSGGSYPLRFEHRSGRLLERIHVKDVLLGLDNIYGFAFLDDLNAGAPLPTDPFITWENVRRVDSGELIRKPAPDVACSWSDFS